jgi:hypothetical protein
MKLAGFNLIMLAVALSQGNLLAQGNEQQNIPIAKELVGKWCYVNLNANTSDALSNSCITLNADGSFEATLDRSTLPGNSSFAGLQDSDYGLWWVKGNRIFYNATTNGQGSFVFQKAKHPREDNAPLLILNGITFASASPHDPW